MEGFGSEKQNRNHRKSQEIRKPYIVGIFVE
jgi:hypothetical protein